MQIAIIGTGSAGLAAAYWLGQHHDVKIFEAENRAGGHAHTVRIRSAGQTDHLSVDTGFIVFNDLNYPNFIKMMDEIGVSSQHSDMSFSVSFKNGAYEYKGEPLGLFAQRRNIVNLAHLQMIRELVRFYKEAPTYLEDPQTENLTLAQLLISKNFSTIFTQRHILPMAAAIWSTPAALIPDFPAESFIKFFINHGLFDLDIYARPQWRTIAGGSARYVEKLLAPHGENIFLGSKVAGLTREQGQYRLILDPHCTNANAINLCHTQRFDHVVLACHSDQAAHIIKVQSPKVASLLSDIPYNENQAVLHQDISLMPRRKAAWAAWNYYSDVLPERKTRNIATPPGPVALTYWMNELQNFETRIPVLVTLNPPHLPHPDKTFGHYVYTHPQFSQKALTAQRALPSVQGRDGLWFCGAWCGYGFHEDGFAAGLAVSAALDCPAPWHHSIEQRSPASQNASPCLQSHDHKAYLYEPA